MSAEEFDAVIESYIARETQDMGEIDAPLFYEALDKIFAAAPPIETVSIIVFNSREPE